MELGLLIVFALIALAVLVTLAMRHGARAGAPPGDAPAPTPDAPPPMARAGHVPGNADEHVHFNEDGIPDNGAPETGL